MQEESEIREKEIENFENKINLKDDNLKKLENQLLEKENNINILQNERNKNESIIQNNKKDFENLKQQYDKIKINFDIVNQGLQNNQNLNENLYNEKNLEINNKEDWNLPLETRLNLLNSIIKEENEENFIIADTWEGEQNLFIDFPSVFKSRGDEIKGFAKQILGLILILVLLWELI